MHIAPYVWYLYVFYIDPVNDDSSVSASSTSSTESDNTLSAGSFSPITDSSSSSTDTNGQSVEKPSTRPTTICCGVKLVGDNIDKHIKPRDMREDAQAQSLHYFNSYAVKDRLSIEGLEDSPCLPDFASFDMKRILTTSKDHEAIKSNFCILVGRVLKKHFKFFSTFATGVVKHTKHKHYEEMSKKSEVVSQKSLSYLVNVTPA